jgi:hypothetical protein
MDGPVSWPALLLLASATIAVNATTALFVGWLVYKVCTMIGAIEGRLLRLEMLVDREK